MEYFIFNNENSKDLGVYLKDYPVKPLPQELVEYHNSSVAGRNSVLTIKQGDYEPLMSLSLSLLAKKDSNKDIILRWLTRIEDDRLFFDEFDDRCYKVLKSKVLNVASDDLESVNINVNFDLKPFIYPIQEDFIEVKRGFELHYEGVKTEPIIKLSLPAGANNYQISINSQFFQLTGVGGNVVIDCELMEVRTEGGQNLLNKTTGDFFTLQEGINRIDWTGNINKFEIFKNSRFEVI